MWLFKKKGNYQEDWDLYNEIVEYATNQLKEGKSEEETKSLVLRSGLYKKWKSKWRTFMTGLRSKEFYQDLKSNMEIDIISNEMNNLIEIYFSKIKLSQDINLESIENYTLSRYGGFKKALELLGYYLSGNELAYEIALLSYQIGLNYPIQILDFLSLVNGTAIFNNEVAEVLLQNQDKIYSFINEFESKYKNN